MDDAALLSELEPEVERLLNRHLESAEEWYPHEHVPWDRASRLQTEGFTHGESALSQGARSALLVNLLTEDNLPWYTRTISRMFGGKSAWGEWAQRWTAEEGRHAIVMRDYFTVTRAVDPVALERARMIQVRSGDVPKPADALEGLAYVSLQELATRISHRNTGKFMTDPIGTEIMSRVGNDENLHHLFYRDLTSAALEIDPSSTILGIEKAVVNFAMPGQGIPNFDRLAKEIARVGIYDLLIHHDQILMPVVKRHWKIEELTGLTSEAEKARENILRHMERTEKVGRRLSSSRVAV